MADNSDILASPEMIQFAVNVAKATYQGKLEWETTADADAFIAPLGGSYTAAVERGWATDENDESYRTYELVLAKAGSELFRLSPGLLYKTDFMKRVGVKHNAFEVFQELWTRANWKAKKITDELATVNQLLGSKLAPEPEDEGDVPF